MAMMSPKNRLIEHVEGSPFDIIDRGAEITTLGEQMLNSADLLEDIKNRALDSGGQQGKAIEKLRDSIGDSYKVLREAGELYKPVGPVINDYGDALVWLQPLIEDAVEDCQRLWSHYQSLPGDRNGSTEEGGGIGGIGDTSAEDAEQNEAAKQAYQDWENRADDFDLYYDSWERAFDDAVTGITSEMAGEIEDGWWDNWGSDLFEVLNTVLSIAGLVVGIIAIFAGGWVVALIIGVAALIVTAVRFAHGEASGWDLALAVVGVIPFGKFATMLGPVDEVADVAGTATRTVSGATEAAGSGRALNSLMRATTGQSADDLARLVRGMEDLGAGRQFLTSQMLVGSLGQHAQNVVAWTQTGMQLDDVPESYRQAVKVYNSWVNDETDY